MTNNNAGITDGVTAHMVRGTERRTYRALVEITVECPPDDDFTSHDLATNIQDALGRTDTDDLVPHDVVMYQTSAWDWANPTRHPHP